MTAYAKIREELEEAGFEHHKTRKVRDSDKNINRLKGIAL